MYVDAIKVVAASQLHEPLKMVAKLIEEREKAGGAACYCHFSTIGAMPSRVTRKGRGVIE